MEAFGEIRTEHDDLIHGLSFDFYGRRLATCSSDHTVRVWDADESDGSWRYTATLTGHYGAVWQVDWAHPEFGQVLASCSFDRKVRVWEEAENHAGERRWTSRAELVDARDSVQSVRFAPRHLGLKLAAASNDGFVRVYKAVDVMNLVHWSLTEEFKCQSLVTGSTNALAWNPSPFGPASMLVATSSPVVDIWQLNEHQRRWEIADRLDGHRDEVLDVAWAPNMGRSFHLVATASRDGTVRIWKLRRRDKASSAAASSSTSTSGTEDLGVEPVARFGDHHEAVWRVQWNHTGTILASSGDDDRVRLWKEDFEGTWRCIDVVDQSIVDPLGSSSAK